MAQVSRTDDAREDLKQIGRYIAQQSGSLETAKRFIRKIYEKCELYATQPEMAEVRPDLGEGVRSFAIDDYVLIYLPLDDGILVLMVTRGARDLPPLFRGRFGQTD